MIKELKSSKEFDIRFSEVDSMSIVWHGSYPLYLEDAREAFGEQYGFGYLTIFGYGYYAPLVEMSIQYKKPMRYGMRARIDITYRPTEAAKIVFDYEIHDAADNTLIATGKTVQVFLDKEYQLVWEAPEFYRLWKEKWGQTEQE